MYINIYLYETYIYIYDDEWGSTEEEEAEETDRTEAEQWENRWLGFEDYESRLAGAYSTNKISELGEACRNCMHFYVENDRKKRRQDEQDREGERNKTVFCIIFNLSGWVG